MATSNRRRELSEVEVEERSREIAALKRELSEAREVARELLVTLEAIRPQDEHRRGMEMRYRWLSPTWNPGTMRISRGSNLPEPIWTMGWWERSRAEWRRVAESGLVAVAERYKVTTREGTTEGWKASAWKLGSRVGETQSLAPPDLYPSLQEAQEEAEKLAFRLLVEAASTASGIDIGVCTCPMPDYMKYSRNNHAARCPFVVGSRYQEATDGGEDESGCGG